MALKIRLRRMGRKKAPTYRIVVAESSMPRDGRFVANLGQYNPRTEPVTLVVDRAKTLAWLDKGAVPTETVENLLKRAGVYSDEPVSPVETVVEAVKTSAKKAGQAVASAAAGAVEAIREAVSGDEEPAVAATPTAVTETEVATHSHEAEPTADAPAADEPQAQ